MVEFDEYASGYTAGMEHPLKRLVGRDADAFLAVKARWLARHLRGAGATAAPLRLLDYGCGIGAFLRALREVGLRAEMAGCDASAGMLEEAVKRWDDATVPTLRLVREERAPFESASFDVVVLSSVLHHLSAEQRPRLLGDALRLLAPRGRVVVFEHNPLNPVTRWVVRHTPIDRNATLVFPWQARRELARLGAAHVTTRFLLFFPPRLAALSRRERWLARVPLGGQYVVVAEKGPAQN
ncbi:MAG TPA: class I SAM-dependent methyltransferase [Candidatus Binatia bacterium]|nr:class I SAM-dependent methyltransferase [Candidatus Binatia bacterium]